MVDVEASLVESGFEVVGAKNAVEALANFDADPAKFKALVTDIRLGTGKSGWDVARHFCHAVPVMPVICMSGESGGDWRAQGVPDSIMITKPFVSNHHSIVDAAQ